MATRLTPRCVCQRHRYHRRMPNIAAVLKEEIARLARKEIKAETASLRKSSVQYRHDVAQLKRELKNAQRRIAVLESELRRSRGNETATADTNGKRFSPRGVRAHREKLGLSAADYGELVGVSGATIYLWETGKARPRESAFARWVEVRGLGKRAALARLAV